MTVQQGVKIIFPDNSYSVAKSEEDARKLHADSEFITINCRYIPSNRSHGYVIIDENNLLSAIYKLLPGAYCNTRFYDYKQKPEFLIWENVIESGKNCMVGRDVDTKTFLRGSTSYLSDWQQIACEYVLTHLNKILIIETRRFYWNLFIEGDHFILNLPDHGKGGEKTWAMKINNPKSKVLIDVD